MRFAQLLANWPWVVGYLAASTVIFIWLRLHSSTDEQAAKAPRAGDGFGAAKDLGLIARSFFRLSCPRLLTVLLVGVWALRLAIGGWNLWDLAVLAGVLAFWPIQEWLVHVFLLHLKPITMFGRKIDPIIARNHRNHHNNPWDPVLGVTPPHIIWLYVAGLPIVWLLALPVPQAMTGVAVYFCMVLNYEWVHYLIHTSYTPRSWFYRRLWVNHRLHHFKNEQFWYGVTMLSGDRILGTQPEPQQTARSETVMTLGVTDEAEGPLMGVEHPAVREQAVPTPSAQAELVSDSRR